MNKVAKVAVCGILAIALHANAQVGAISNDAMQIVNKNAAARKLLAERLGLTTITSVEAANVALRKMPAPDQAAILKAITAYEKTAVAGNTPAAAASNLAAAKAAFATNTSAVQVAAAAQGSVSNKATAAAAKGMTCNLEEIASDIATRTGFSTSTVSHLIGKKVINLKSTNCGGDIREMKDANLKNLVFAADYADRKGVLSVSEEAGRDQLFGEGLATAWKVNEGRSNVDIAGGVQSVQSIRANGNCAYFF